MGDKIDILNKVTKGLLREVDTEGGVGSSDYDELTSKPQINGVTLSGNKTSLDLGLQSSEENKGLSTEDFSTAEKSKLADQSGINTGDETKIGIISKLEVTQANITALASLKSTCGFSAVSSQTTIPATTITIPSFSTELMDTHNSFDGTVFTVPADMGGYYLISGIYTVNSVADGTLLTIGIFKNSNTGTFDYLLGRQISGGLGIIGCAGSVLIPLNGGDTIRIGLYCTAATAGSSNSGYCSFSAKRIQ